MEGARSWGRSRKTWEQCVRDDMKLLGLHSEWAIFRDMWRDLIWGKRLMMMMRYNIGNYQQTLIAGLHRYMFQ